MEQFISQLSINTNGEGFINITNEINHWIRVNEIKEAIELITTNQNETALISNTTSGEEKAELMDRHLKEILIRLSQKST